MLHAEKIAMNTRLYIYKYIIVTTSNRIRLHFLMTADFPVQIETHNSIMNILFLVFIPEIITQISRNRHNHIHWRE